MSYPPPQNFSPPPAGSLYSSTPPAPPPKPPTSTTPSRGPPPPPPPPPGYGSQQHEVSELDAGRGSPPQQQPQQQHGANAPPESMIPPIGETWLPEILLDKSTQDLQHLLSSPDLQKSLLSDPRTTHPAITASEDALAPLIHANIDLAHSALELEARLGSLREQTQARLLTLRALKQQHTSKTQEAEAAVWEFSPMALKQRLNASVAEQEALLRGLEESWVEEDGVAAEREVAEFVRRVKEARRVAFLRSERKQRWDEARVGGWR